MEFSSSEYDILRRLVQEFHPIRAGLSAMTVFARGRHLSLTWANYIQSTVFHPI
jgi:hypothetical protein